MGWSLPGPWHHRRDLCKSILLSDPYSTWHRIDFNNGRGHIIYVHIFKETCKILGIRKVNTSSYHPSSNGMIETWHRSLHSGLSYFIDAANMNWDHLVSFLVAYRALPNKLQASVRTTYFMDERWRYLKAMTWKLISEKKILTTIPD